MCSQTVLVTVCFMADWTQHLGRSSVNVVISRNMNIETVLIFHFSVAMFTPEPEPFIKLGLTQGAHHVHQNIGVNRQGQVSNSTHPTCCSCNTEQT